MQPVVVNPKTIYHEAANKKYVIQGGVFKELSAERVMPLHKAYLQIDEAGSAKVNLIFNDGSTTSIDEVPSTVSFKNSPVYNLQGQRVSHPHNGIYISKGRKFVVK